MANSGLLNPYYMPSHKSESVVNLDTLIGGLNTYELPYRLGVNETPDIANLLWRDGALGGRDAQAWLCSVPDINGEGAYTCFDGRYGGYEFYHVGRSIWYTDGTVFRVRAEFDQAGTYPITSYGFIRVLSASDPEVTWDGNVITVPKDGHVEVYYQDLSIHQAADLSKLYPGYEPSRGVFLRYQDDLIYKARGVFVRISRREGDNLPANERFSVTDVLSEAYTPITQINADAATGAGDAYQPENRLSPRKTVWYNASVKTVTEGQTVSSGATSVSLTTENPVRVSEVYLGGARIVEGVDWTYDRESNKITLFLDVESAKRLVAHVEVAADRYYIPVRDAEAVSVEARRTADGDIVPLTCSTAALAGEPTGWEDAWDGDFVFWAPTGLVLFKTAPYAANPAAPNTVRITYTKANETAQEAIMSCKYAIVYGGDTNLCMVLGGSAAQPNAIFWNGNNVSMDITYWPAESYNLAGDNAEPVTGFGRQQNMLVIFKEGSVSKASLGTQTVGDRLYITMDTVSINSRIGCDLPYSIQLIDNNLVFCNTQGGIHVLLDTSAANENNIRGISKKVNGTPARAGILQKVRAAGAERCCSFDDDARYWLVIGDEVYVWDYVLSSYKDPSFFYLTNIPAIAFTRTDGVTHYLHADGRITAMGAFTEEGSPHSIFAHSDYGAPIPKRYVSPVLFFGDNDRLKDVNSVILTVASDTWSRMQITYTTDCETRRDLTDAMYLFYTFAPRNLHARCLSPKTYSATVRRKPGCRHVRYFSVTVESAEAGMDMSLVSAQIFYRKQGRDR